MEEEEKENDLLLMKESTEEDSSQVHISFEILIIFHRVIAN